jgi:hypothetical protein
MSDLVERLLKVRGVGATTGGWVTTENLLCREAADEIERLTAALAGARADAAVWRRKAAEARVAHPCASAEAALAAEREKRGRLEAALRTAQVYVETDYSPGPRMRGSDANLIRAAIGDTK